MEVSEHAVPGVHVAQVPAGFQLGASFAFQADPFKSSRDGFFDEFVGDTGYAVDVDTDNVTVAESHTAGNYTSVFRTGRRRARGDATELSFPSAAQGRQQ